MAKTRASETRDNEVVHEVAEQPWKRGASLEMPPAKPGHDQRWIRFSWGDKPDPTNLSRKMREGWKVREATSVPEEWHSLKMDQGKHAGSIVIEGMILCERPKSLSARRTVAFKTETDRRTQALHHDLDTTNRSVGKSDAYGPIQKAMSSKPMREVKIQEDETQAAE